MSVLDDTHIKCLTCQSFNDLINLTMAQVLNDPAVARIKAKYRAELHVDP